MRLLLMGLLTVAVGFGCGSVTRVNPDEIDDVLTNPGIGFETFHSFNGDGQPKNYPVCSIAYFRLYWNVLEKQEGVYNFGLIDSLLAVARANGQDLALRFMAMDTEPKAPRYFIDKGGGKWWDHKGRGGPRPTAPMRIYSPDFNSSYFLSRQEALVRAFGERYNGHPDIIRMDIGSIGRWGEWHTHQDRTGIPMPTDDNALRVIDWYLKYWSKTPKSMLINYVPGLRHAARNGCGWRADSLGDWGHFSDTWCHMIDMYPGNLAEAEALEAWKRGPVTFEPPGSNVDLEDYVTTKSGGYDNMWKQALEWGGSSYSGKSRPIADSQVPAMERFLKRCGYRFVLRSLSHPREGLRGRDFTVSMEFENVGVAPPYKDYVVAVRLLRDGEELVFDSDARLTAWLPGVHKVQRTFELPANLEPGGYDLDVGILDPHYREAEIRLAVEGLGDDGWYRLSRVKVG